MWGESKDIHESWVKKELKNRVVVEDEEEMGTSNYKRAVEKNH